MGVCPDGQVVCERSALVERNPGHYMIHGVAGVHGAVLGLQTRLLTMIMSPGMCTMAIACAITPARMSMCHPSHTPINASPV